MTIAQEIKRRIVETERRLENAHLLVTRLEEELKDLQGSDLKLEVGK